MNNTTIEQLWSYACNGNTKALETYYNSVNESERVFLTNRRYFRFGEHHSLLMGAFRNNQYKTVLYLLSQGEEITPKERKEIEQRLEDVDIMRLMVK